MIQSRVNDNGITEYLIPTGNRWIQAGQRYNTLTNQWEFNVPSQYILKSQPYYDPEEGTFVIDEHTINVTVREYVSARSIWNGKSWQPDPKIWERRDSYYAKIDHVWHSGRWYHKSEELPIVPPTLGELGLTVGSPGLGCGTRYIAGYDFAVYKTKEEAAAAGHPNRYFDCIVEGYKKYLKDYEGRITGIFLTLVNPTQYPTYGPLLEAVGFKLLSKQNNYNHGDNHPNYLYAWKCEDHAKKVVEKASTWA